MIVRPVREDEIDVVALRMRLTLVEVLGEARGTAMYDLDWLRDRVRFHLDPARSTGAVYVAEDDGGAVVGHTIVRVDEDEDGRPIGLFSTTYVEPAARRGGVASALIAAGEAWFRGKGMQTAWTYTSAGNDRLIRLYRKHGYEVVDRRGDMIRIRKEIG